MSITRLDISLERYEVGLSGAVPNREDWSEPAMDRGILEFVSLFSGLVIKYGGRIVHGCHPTFTPILLRQARLHGSRRQRKPLTLIMSDLWAQSLPADEISAMADIAEFIVTKKLGSGGPADVTTRNQSLSAMRRVLIDSQNVMVAVGGKMHSHDQKVPGVGEEMGLAEKKRIPRFLVGGLGGFARKLASEITPSHLNNALSHEANAALFGSNDVASCVSILFEHFASSSQLAQASFQPVLWNPGTKKILDHRDGTIAVESSDCILRAEAV